MTTSVERRPDPEACAQFVGSALLDVGTAVHGVEAALRHAPDGVVRAQLERALEKLVTVQAGLGRVRP